MISNLIHIELAHINTNHPDFIGGERAEREALRMEEATGTPALGPVTGAVPLLAHCNLPCGLPIVVK
jgi:hypothetical protein